VSDSYVRIERCATREKRIMKNDRVVVVTPEGEVES